MRQNHKTSLYDLKNNQSMVVRCNNFRNTQNSNWYHSGIASQQQGNQKCQTSQDPAGNNFNNSTSLSGTKTNGDIYQSRRANGFKYNSHVTTELIAIVKNQQKANPVYNDTCKTVSYDLANSCSNNVAWNSDTLSHKGGWDSTSSLDIINKEFYAQCNQNSLEAGIHYLESLDNDYSNKKLISIYITLSRYQEAIMKINSLEWSGKEEQQTKQYYEFLISRGIKKILSII